MSKNILVKAGTVAIFVALTMSGCNDIHTTDPGLSQPSSISSETNPNLSETSKADDQLYGNYAFEKQIYMNPLSSFIAFDDFKQYYMLSENYLTVRNINGSQQIYPIIYKKTAVDKQTFKDEFLFEDFNILDTTSCQDFYQLTEDTETSEYRIYQMDNELWLAHVRTEKSDNDKKSTYIWSIYEIKKFEGEFPVKSIIYGSTEGVDDFLTSHGDYQSGYMLTSHSFSYSSQT